MSARENSTTAQMDIENNREEKISQNKVLNGVLVLASIPVIITLCIALIIPILQLAFGAHYINQCPINRYIPIYLIVSGTCGIVTILLLIIILLSLITLVKGKSIGSSIASGAVIFLAMGFIFLMSIFLFAWFIAGNVWIFSARKSVQHDNPSGENYCHRTLYGFAFWILIVAYISACLSCCCNCARGIFKKNKS